MPRKTSTKKYKLKTHKATAKRFHVTGSGKLMRTKIGKSHRRRVTPKRTKLQFKRTVETKGRGIVKRVHRLAPNLK